MATDPTSLIGTDGAGSPQDWQPLAGDSTTGLRREPREDIVRIVEYTAFPRRRADHRPRYGFTRDVSDSGMCLGVEAAESIGTLLRVTVRGVDGSPSHTAIERVVWCSAARDGRYWLGLELLSDGRPERAVKR